MTRTTRNSQRAASQPVPPPSPPPFRRPPTGSKAQRSVLGDLIPQPPPAPASPDEEDNSGQEEEGEYDADYEEQRSASSDDTEIGFPGCHSALRRKYIEEPELKNLEDVYWKSDVPVVHKARRPRPKRQEDVEYYQEHEWGTDDEEYPDPNPPTQQSQSTNVKPERNPYVLFEGESVERNRKRHDQFEPVVANRKIRMYKFSAPNEGRKIRLVESDERGNLWAGFKSPPRPPRRAARGMLPEGVLLAKYYVPEPRVYDVDENGEPLDLDEGGNIITYANPQVHPYTDLPTAEVLQVQLRRFLSEAKLVDEEFAEMRKEQAAVYGKLLMEGEELEEEELEMQALWARLQKVMDPGFFKTLRSRHPRKIRIKEPFLDGDPAYDDLRFAEALENEDGEEAGENENEDETGEDENGEDENEEDENEDNEPIESAPLGGPSDGEGADSDTNSEEGDEPTPAGLTGGGTNDGGGYSVPDVPYHTERDVDAEDFADHIAIPYPDPTTPSAAAAADEHEGEGEDESEDDTREKEKVLTPDTSLDAEAFANGLLEQPNWQSTPPRTTTSTSNENENAGLNQKKIVGAERVSANPLAEKLAAPFLSGQNGRSLEGFPPPQARGAVTIEPQVIVDALARARIPLPPPMITSAEDLLPPPPRKPDEEVVTKTAGAKENTVRTPTNNPYVPMRLPPTSPTGTLPPYSFVATTQANAKAFGVPSLAGPRRRPRSGARIALQTIQSPKKGSDDEYDADEEKATEREGGEEKKAEAAFEIYTGPSLPPNMAELDKAALKVKRETVEEFLKDQIPIDDPAYDWSEYLEDEVRREEAQAKAGQEGVAEREEGLLEEVAEATLPVVPQFQDWVKRENAEFEASQLASDSEDESAKVPLNRRLFAPTSTQKRTRDESDGEDPSDDSDEEKENSYAANKKRRISGSYGSSVENAPFISGSPVDNDREETDEPSWNRPQSPFPERGGSEDYEDEHHIASLLSARSPTSSTSSRTGSPKASSNSSVTPPREIWPSAVRMERSFAPSPSPSAHPMIPVPTPLFNTGPFSGAQFNTLRGTHTSTEDVDMSDDEKEVGTSTSRPIPARFAPAPPVSPQSAAPAIFGRRPLTGRAAAMGMGMLGHPVVDFKSARK